MQNIRNNRNLKANIHRRERRPRRSAHNQKITMNFKGADLCVCPLF
jgi:hypothetical protein